MSTFDNARFLLSLFYKHPNEIRYIPRWLASLTDNYLLNKQSPWITFSCLKFLDTLDLQGKKVFEYGSGGSTLYWLKKGASCVSIEHDKKWYDKMKSSCNAVAHIDYRLVEPQKIADKEMPFDPANPDQCRSNGSKYKDYSFSQYVHQIDEFPDEYFDLVMIDGRARSSCIKRSFNKVCRGGFIIVDNAERNYYLKETIHYLKNFSRQEFPGLVPITAYVSKTDLFTRLE